MFRITFIIAFFLLSINTYAQDDKTVTLVVNGQGKTQDEARQNALRSAIEQAFGSFVSSKTEILNDKLIKDEIVSVTNGNIQNYEVINEVQIPNGLFVTMLRAKVSVSRLSSFVESKGFAVELKGGLLALNVKQQIINEKNESKSIDNISFTCKKILDKSCDFNLSSSDPIQNGSNNEWGIPLSIGVKFNKNIETFNEYLFSSLDGLSMTLDEVYSFNRLGKKTYKILIKDSQPINIDIGQLKNIDTKYRKLHYQITYLGKVKFESNNLEKVEKKLNQFKIDDKEGTYKLQYFNEYSWSLFHFRSLSTVYAIIDLIYYTKKSLLNFEINNGLTQFNFGNYISSQMKDGNYKFFGPKNKNIKLTKDEINPIYNRGDNIYHNENYKGSLFSDSYSTTLPERPGLISSYIPNEYNKFNYEGLEQFQNVWDRSYINMHKEKEYDAKIDLDEYALSFKNIIEIYFLDILKLSDLEKVNKYSIRALD